MFGAGGSGGGALAGGGDVLGGVVTPTGGGGGLGGGGGEDAGDEGDKYWLHPAFGTFEAAKTTDVVLPLLKLVDCMVTPLGRASVK